MMSKKLELILNSAIKKANALKHEYLTLETILLELVSNDAQVQEILRSCGVESSTVQKELEDFINDSSNFSILDQAQISLLSEKQFVDEELRELARESGIEYQPEISTSLQRVIQRAAIHVQSSGKKTIRGVNILVAMFQEKESFAVYVLRKHGVERFDVVRTISHGLDQSLTENRRQGSASSEAADGESIDGSGGNASARALDQYAVNLNLLAEKKKIDPVVGREHEIERIVQVLCRRRKNNPLLVGEAGVGKTAIAEGLAWKIVEKEVPEVLMDTEVWSLDMASLLAGAKFRGDFEQRLKNVIKDLEKLNDDGQKTVLFIDEMHVVMGAGATAGSSMDASNLLKPALSAGSLKCLGSTTHEEYRKFIEKDPAFSRRFQKIDVEEPSLDDTYKILLGLREKFEEHHAVKYPSSVLKLAVDLSAKYITDRKNPDKSIDVIDEAGAALQLLPASKKRQQVKKKDIEKIVAQLARIPQINVIGAEKKNLKDLKPNLKMLIYGQDHAVEKVADTVIMSRSGLGDDRKPMASFLFAGPTGVGKTELARQLALQLGSHLERIDMSEYMEKHSVAKLIGAPPGYVGYDQGGLLTDALKKHPHCVLLLDEIEKAHPDVYNILLQVMDNGTLTDAQGRTTDFRNAVIIMTTNAGAKEMEAGAIGLSSSIGPNDNSSKRDQALKNFFSPEFRNRLDAIVHFNKLGSDFIVRIVEKFLMELESKLATKNVAFEVSEKAKLWLAEVGYDPKMGARPIARLIDERLKRPLSKEILFGHLVKGGRVMIDLDTKKELTFKFESHT